jgi:malate-CoA ligase subunit alpha
MKELGIGISTSVGIGGDPINGSSFLEILKHFEDDDETEAIMIIGEIGGPQEAEVAEYFQKHMNKPMSAYIAGLTAPPGRLMGHAGAIVNSTGESASEKVIILKDAGIMVSPTPSDMGKTIAKMLKRV